MVKNLTAMCLALILVFALAPQVHAESATPSASPVPTQKTEDNHGSNRGKDDRGFGIGPTIKAFREEQKEQFKEEMAAMKLQMQTRREEFKTKLQGIKDGHRKDILDKLDTKIATISGNRTERMGMAVDKMEAILASISAKAAVEKQNGKDTTALDKAIADAETALASASAAVAAQAAKTYTITITDDATARENAGTTIRQMHMDLMETHKAVMNAKRALMVAARELRKLQTGAATTPVVTAAITVTPTLLPTATIVPTVAATATPTP